MAELINKLPLKQEVNQSMLRLLLGATNWVHIWYRAGKSTAHQIARSMVSMIHNSVSE